jgi:hypothetical protein
VTILLIHTTIPSIHATMFTRTSTPLVAEIVDVQGGQCVDVLGAVEGEKIVMVQGEVVVELEYAPSLPSPDPKTCHSR